MAKIRRTLGVGFVVGLIFIYLCMNWFYKKNWRFNLFSTDDWEHIWTEFKSGWVISATSDWIFVWTLIFMVPLFIFFWWLTCKVRWRKSIKTAYHKTKTKLVKKDPKKVVKKKIKISDKKPHHQKRPLPINSIGRPEAKISGKTMDAPKDTYAGQSASVPTGYYTQQSNTVDILDEDTSNIALDDIQLPERTRLEEDMTSLMSQSNYQVIRDVDMGDISLAYVGISADKVLLCITDTEKGEWLADEEFFNDEEPLWFSESSHRISPVYRLTEVAKKLKQKISEKGFKQEVIPVFVEKEGTIINAVDMQETWNKQGVIVCRTDLGGPEELPSFAAALPPASDKGSSDDFNAIRELL